MQVYRKPFNDTMLPSRTFFHIPVGSAAETVRDKGAMPSVSDGKLTQLLMAFSTFYREILHSGTSYNTPIHASPGYNADPILSTRL